MPAPSSSRHSARVVVARAIAGAAQHFPDIDAQTLSVDALDDREARLALAIHRTVLQRWLTIEYLLNEYLKKPLRTMEPSLQGILLSAGAQLLFMDRLPAHAVVDESVKLARTMVRPGATGIVNAVLRRISELSDQAVHGKPWAPAEDRLPLDDGYVPLKDPILWEIGEWTEETPVQNLRNLEMHLSIATSHPVQLVRAWLNQYGPTKTIALCAHGVQLPPLVVVVEPGFAEDPMALIKPADEPAASKAQPAQSPRTPVRGSPDASATPEPRQPLWEPHEHPGFIIWLGAYRQLTAFLKRHPARRVQDVTATKAVLATADLAPGVIIDYCAGRGTKTRQFTTVHPNASIVASDTDDERRSMLRSVFEKSDKVRVVQIESVESAVRSARPQSAGADLLLLDVPCTNTGVIARRPEARYRFNDASLQSLVRLQRTIIQKSLPLLATGGHLLYSTCSIDHAENQVQRKWIEENTSCTLLKEFAELPGGSGTTYHDGGYWALLKKK